MLPANNSIIENWNNFNIIANTINGEWVLEVIKNNKEAMVWYRDVDSELKDRVKWTIIGALISATIGMITSFVLHKIGKGKIKSKLNKLHVSNIYK